MEDITDLLKIYKVKNTDDLVKYIRGKVNFNAYKNNQRLQEISEAPNSIKDDFIKQPLLSLYKRKQVREGYLFLDEILTDDQVLKEVIEEEIINLCYHYDEVSDDNIFVESEAIRIINIQIERLTLLKFIEQYEAVNSSKGKDGKKPKGKELNKDQERFMRLVVANLERGIPIGSSYKFANNELRKRKLKTYSESGAEALVKKIRSGFNKYEPFSRVDPQKGIKAK
jgi:hypothetical protein